MTISGRNQPIEIVAGQGTQCLHLRAIVGILIAPELQEAARSLVESGDDVRVDGTVLEHLDCAAVQVLLALRAALDERGRNVEVVLSERVLATLRAAGVAEALIGRQKGKRRKAARSDRGTNSARRR